MAAIGESGLLSDKIYIKVSEDQIFLGFVYPHTLDVFLAAHAVSPAEFSGKGRIAQMTFGGDIRDPYIFSEPAVDVLGYVVNTSVGAVTCGTFPYIQSGAFPVTYYPVYQTVYL